jgi:hypothetical protein
MNVDEYDMDERNSNNFESSSYADFFKIEKELKRKNLKSFSPMVYLKPLPTEVAESQRKLENANESSACLELSQDIAANKKDYEREKRAEQFLREKEEAYETALEKWRKVESKASINLDSLKSNELELYNSTDASTLMSWIQEVRAQRLVRSKTKQQMATIRRGLEQDLKLVQKATSSNQWKINDENGRMEAIFKTAPKYVSQDLKRSKEEIGREVATMFCKQENLKLLDVESVVKLLTEYKEVWLCEEAMWNIIHEILEHIFQNKKDMTRQGLTEACFPVLNAENQAKSKRALDVLFSNVTSTYEFKLPCEATSRREKVRMDGKGKVLQEKKIAIRDKTINDKFQHISRGSSGGFRDKKQKHRTSNHNSGVKKYVEKNKRVESPKKRFNKPLSNYKGKKFDKNFVDPRVKNHSGVKKESSNKK